MLEGVPFSAMFVVRYRLGSGGLLQIKNKFLLIKLMSVARIYMMVSSLQHPSFDFIIIVLTLSVVVPTVPTLPSGIYVSGMSWTTYYHYVQSFNFVFCFGVGLERVLFSGRVWEGVFLARYECFIYVSTTIGISCFSTYIFLFWALNTIISTYSSFLANIDVTSFDILRGIICNNVLCAV